MSKTEKNTKRYSHDYFMFYTSGEVRRVLYETIWGGQRYLVGECEYFLSFSSKMLDPFRWTNQKNLKNFQTISQRFQTHLYAYFPKLTTVEGKTCNKEVGNSTRCGESCSVSCFADVAIHNRCSPIHFPSSFPPFFSFTVNGYERDCIRGMYGVSEKHGQIR